MPRPPKSQPLTAKEQAFCDAIVAGAKYLDAYVAAGYSLTGRSAMVDAGKIMRRPRVAAYIAEQRAKSATRASMSRDDAIAWLVAAIQATPADANMDNPLCELRMSKSGPYAALPDKSRCMDRLAKMLGWDEPEQHALAVEVVIGGNMQSSD